MPGFLSLPIRLLILALLSAWALPAASAVAVDAPDEIRRLVTPFLPEAGSAGQLEELAGEILATEGYFSPVIEFSERDATLRLTIDPGPRTTIGDVDLTVDGPIDPEIRQRLIAGWRLPVGRPFRQTDWNDAKQQILLDLLGSEYADARLVDSQARIDTAARRASLRIHYDVGPRYRYGALQVDGLQRYTPDLVARYNTSVHPGQPYRESDLATLIGNLQASPYFASVSAELDRTQAVPGADGSARAPVRLRVRERPAHRLAFGLGASSNTGARVEANYHTPNLFSQAWELNSGLRLEEKRQTIYADVFLPPDARQRRHSVGGMLETADIQGLKTQRHALGVQSVQQRGSIEQRLALNWQQERREPDGAPEVLSRALVPGVTWTWRRVDNLLDPRQGTILQLGISGGSKALLSDQNFVRLHGRWQQYLPLGQRDTLGLRAELGRTFADARQHIPQDYLFRTGGAGSVRGYAYQSLGVREGNAVVGGRYLAVASAEYTHWLNEAWGVALFVDAGDAVDALLDARLAVGYGLGARWKSPAGPIGADLARGQRTGELQLHFSLSIPF